MRILIKRQLFIFLLVIIQFELFSLMWYHKMDKNLGFQN